MKIINDQIKQCNLCTNVIKFEFDTVSFGKCKDLLFIGESPAKNGWCITGRAFYDVNNKVLPTGKILDKLLSIIDLGIDDITFTEACKCQVPERKNLKECSINCSEFLKKQILKIDPKILIPLGDHPTKIILKDLVKYKNFGEVAGKVFSINIKGKEYKVVPIYHPSPISPIGYKGNVEIFKHLKDII